MLIKISLLCDISHYFKYFGILPSSKIGFMKHTFLLLFIAALFVTSCKKESATTNNNSNSPIVGEWVISSFVDNGVNEISQFAGYTFNFDANNNMQVNSGMMMNMCSWTFKDSIYHFNMMGMHSNALDMMDDDWKLMNFSDTTCYFVDTRIGADRNFRMRRN